VEIGAGVSILPEPTVRREVASGTLVAVPLADERLRRPIGVIRRRRKTTTPAMARFIDLLQAVCTEWDADRRGG